MIFVPSYMEVRQLFPKVIKGHGFTDVCHKVTLTYKIRKNGLNVSHWSRLYLANFMRHSPFRKKKKIGSRLAGKELPFNKSLNFVTVFKRARHWVLSCARHIQSKPS